MEPGQAIALIIDPGSHSGRVRKKPEFLTLPEWVRGLGPCESLPYIKLGLPKE